ncbi:DUF551 domain-containing protein [Dysosmobacter welbionis]|uniref:DUF551 domain-containing protein n=1 Tax=Podoviridae sp. ctIpM11 TaxID=2825240 RepID=A0A8S5UUH8_9CAUD|nr:MAG TPA: Protein of unknown function (DUF551) [Podoviridae sp. ctIpM11]
MGAMETDCEKCLHQKVCALWRAHESQDASCFSLDGCDYFDATLTPPNEWVSVEERLPGSQEDVLVVAFWHECWQTMIGWHSDAGKKWRVITPHGEREPGGVSHWMPIPAPPDRRPPEGEEDTQ